MIIKFSEIAFLSDRDLGALLAEVDNRVLILALHETALNKENSFVRERIVSCFSYVGWKLYEMDRNIVVPSGLADIVACQEAIIEIANRMIEDCGFEDYCIQKVS